MSNLVCRLCGNPTVEKWTLTVLSEISVKYYECNSCLSLQTEKPSWLQRAYSSNISSLDTGILARNLNNFAICLILCRILNITKSVDFGSGDGLLTRYLRDHDIDAYAFEKYGSPKYAQGFSQTDWKNIGLITAFEVFEHFENPAIEIEKIFSCYPDYILISTELYSNQNENWPYLSTHSGQHIFFYSVQAINLIAEKYNYGVTNLGNNIIFFNLNISNAPELVERVKILFVDWIFESLKKNLLANPSSGFIKDNAFLINKLSSSKNINSGLDL